MYALVVRYVFSRSYTPCDINVQFTIKKLHEIYVTITANTYQLAKLCGSYPKLLA